MEMGKFGEIIPNEFWVYYNKREDKSVIKKSIKLGLFQQSEYFIYGEQTFMRFNMKFH